MFQKVFEYAGPHKKGLYAATAVVLVSVLMGVLPFVLAYQVIAPLVMGAELDASFLILRVALVLVCLVLQAVLYGWGLNLSHKAAYDTLLRLRTALQKRFEKLPLGVIQDKGTGTVKKLFVDDVDSLEVLLAHSMPEGIANLMVPIAVYVAMFFVDWKLALLSLASIPISLIAMMTMYSVGMKKMGPYYMAGQKMNNTIIEYINGMEVVKVFNKDADSYERFRKDVSDYRDYTLAWYKAAWPWMAIYSSLLPCTVILTLPLGAWFVLSGWSALPDLILVLCLSLSIGMPLLKSLGFLPTMPQLDYKISALEQVLDAPELQQTPDSFHGKNNTIVYDHVSFGYGEVQETLSDLSAAVAPGECVLLCGSSGCGKTTTLRIIAGLELPDVGQVILEGQDITNREPNKRDVNTVFQNYALFPHMNVSDNVGYGLKIRKVPKAEIAERVEQALRLVQLEGYGKRMPDQLSGGQKQRIAIARAVINEPKVLLLDEPLGALDLKLRRQMQLELKRLQKQLGITFIYITHDQEEAINMSDRIGVMHEGILEQLGTPNEVYYQPQTSYVADFVGNANILRLGGETFAIRSENILMNGETVCTREAVVVEKSLAGGQLRILFRLPDGQTLTASRYGIDNDLQPGQQVRIGWEEPHAVKVIDNDKDENNK